jgi:acetate kinase
MKYIWRSTYTQWKQSICKYIQNVYKYKQRNIYIYMKNNYITITIHNLNQSQDKENQLLTNKHIGIIFQRFVFNGKLFYDMVLYCNSECLQDITTCSGLAPQCLQEITVIRATVQVHAYGYNVSKLCFRSCVISTC